MISRQKPSDAQVDAFLSRARSHGFSYPEVGATCAEIPAGYTIDHNRVVLGRGSATFHAASIALQRWQMFDLLWVKAFPDSDRIEKGTTVAVLISHLGFWSLNASRIVYVIEDSRRFGFAYGTLADHAEKGEERFQIEWLEDDTVAYDILAFSKPAMWWSKVGRPFARALQKRFARDSMSIMRAISRRSRDNI